MDNAIKPITDAVRDQWSIGERTPAQDELFAALCEAIAQRDDALDQALHNCRVACGSNANHAKLWQKACVERDELRAQLASAVKALERVAASDNEVARWAKRALVALGDQEA